MQRGFGFAPAAAILAAIAFAGIALDYVTDGSLARWDVSFARWLSDERTTLGIDAFHVLTFLGGTAAMLVITTAVVVVLYRRQRLLEAAVLPLVVAGSVLLNLILKLSFQRPRPDVAVVDLETYSFPSGHAMISTAVYGALANLAWSHLCSRRARVLLVGGTTVLVGLICFSRLYLGVHYPSDVLAGAAGGASWLATSITLQATYGERFVGSLTGSSADRIERRSPHNRRVSNDQGSGPDEGG